MELSGVYRSVSGELKELEEELKVQMREMCEHHAREREDRVFLEGIVSHVFKAPGKRLRPILVLLSARADAPDRALTKRSTTRMRLSRATSSTSNFSLY